MKEFILDLNSLNDINDFITGIKNIPCDINASYEKQIVDAKSYLGLVSISTHPITVSINTDNPNYIETFSQVCKRYL